MYHVGFQTPRFGMIRVLVFLFVFAFAAAGLLRDAVTQDVDTNCVDHGHHNFIEEVDVFNASLLSDVSELSALANSLKLACLGKAWNPFECRKTVQDLRDRSWLYLVRETTGMALFSHLRHSHQAPVIQRFRKGGGYAAPVNCRADGKKSHFFFRHIYKNDGLAIKKNLAANAGVQFARAVDPDWVRNDRCGAYNRLGKHILKPVLFTFVRDPVEKFIAGYSEIVAHRFIDRLRNARAGTVEHAMIFLDNVFHGTCDDGHVLLQVQSLFGPSCESKFDYIGRLERFEDDWRELSSNGGCDADRSLQWPLDISQVSRENDVGADKAMRQALSLNNGKLMRALCFWLLPDFFTFDYELPEACHINEVLRAIYFST